MKKSRESFYVRLKRRPSNLAEIIRDAFKRLCRGCLEIKFNEYGPKSLWTNSCSWYEMEHEMRALSRRWPDHTFFVEHVHDELRYGDPQYYRYSFKDGRKQETKGVLSYDPIKIMEFENNEDAIETESLVEGVSHLHSNHTLELGGLCTCGKDPATPALHFLGDTNCYHEFVPESEAPVFIGTISGESRWSIPSTVGLVTETSLCLVRGYRYHSDLNKWSRKRESNQVSSVGNKQANAQSD